MDKRFLRILLACFAIVLVILWGILVYLFYHGIGPFAVSSEGRVPLLGITLFVTSFVCLIIMVPIAIGRFVYVDAHKRGMNRILWTLVAIFVPYFVGLVVYLVIRTPLQGHCSSCNAVVNQNTLFCPQCGEASKRQCATCKAVLETNDRFCSHCGAAIGV